MKAAAKSLKSLIQLLLDQAVIFLQGRDFGYLDQVLRMVEGKVVKVEYRTAKKKNLETTEILDPTEAM